MKIRPSVRPVGAELFHATGRTDAHNEANSHFSQFCVVPKNESKYSVGF